MLKTLRVKNLAIVERIEVEFGPGLNVITGETGAGKSILVGALDLVLGGRADKSLIRAGAEEGGVEAVFQVDKPEAVHALLDSSGVDRGDDGLLILRRVVAAAGGGKTIVNGCAATVQMLKRVGDLLVDMHGPHDHQSLLSEDFQLEVLDGFGAVGPVRDAYGAAYQALLDAEQRLKELEPSGEDVAGQLEMLAYQIKEIEDAALSGEEEETLAQDHARAAHAQRILELANAAGHALTEDDASAFQQIVLARRALDEWAGLVSEAGPWQKEAESIAIQIKELAAAVSSRAESLDADPQRLQSLEDRMAAVHRLKRKYGGSVPDVLAFLDKAKARFQDLSSRGERLQEARKERDAAMEQVKARGAKLSRARHAVADRLAAAITEELRALGFPHGAFEVALQPAAPRPSGLDQTEFGFAPNVGEPLRPLRAIASSGEISRVMLATKAVLADHDRIPVLVFDEIDANLGGEMGNAVGRKLAHVARTHQVLCITHLPQVAVHGQTHLRVAKSVEGGRTRTAVSPLAAADRAEELARMLGGRDMTSVTLKHAREMLRKAAAQNE